MTQHIYFFLIAVCGGWAHAHASLAANEGPINAARDLQFQASYQFDDNVTRAGADVDKLSDSIVNLDLGRRWIFPLNANTRALLILNLGGERFFRFDGLSRLRGGAQAELQYRGSAAFDAPTFALSGRVAAEQFQSALRDGYRYSFGASVRQSLTNRISYFAAITHNGRAADSDVFSGQENVLRLNLDYQFNAASTLYLGSEFRRGDSVTTATPSTENAGIATALARNDDAYPGRGLTSYRFDGKSVLTTLGYNLGLNAQSSLDFSWRRIRVWPEQAEQLITIPSSYVTNQFSVAYLLRF